MQDCLWRLVLWPFRPRPVLPELNADEYVALAAYSADSEEWKRALHFTREAIRLAPTSARLRMDEGYFLQELGRTKDALRAYEAAAELADDGEPLFHVGILLARMGRHGEAAAAFIRAFERSPELALEVNDIPEVSETGRDPAFRDARRRALSRL